MASSVDEVVRTWFTNWLPGDAARRATAEAFAKGIEAAHEVGPNRWSLLVGPAHAITLMAGEALALRLTPKGLAISVLDDFASPGLLEQAHENRWLAPWSYYGCPIRVTALFIPLSVVAEVVPRSYSGLGAFADLFARSVRQAAKAQRHSNDAVHVISEIAARELPLPRFDMSLMRYGGGYREQFWRRLKK